jgi:hypothetical protein
MKGTPSFADILMYADDGLLFSRKKFDATQVTEFFASLGLTIAPEKSGWICEAGKWEKPLKFLGLSYHPDKGLSAATREGAELKFDKGQMLIAANSKPFKIPPLDTLSGIGPSSDFNEYIVHRGKESFGCVTKAAAKIMRLELTESMGGY